jgi:uncharacterized membrane protein YgdD (TMEM256/DUF423 family)
MALPRTPLVLESADILNAMNWSAIGAISLGLAVGLGAFGAHGLRSRLDAYSMGVYEKAVFYHFIHAIGLLIVPVLAKIDAVSQAGSSRVCWLLIAGILIFSGSLYALSISGVRTLGAITPLGGLSFIGAWALLAWELLRSR